MTPEEIFEKHHLNSCVEGGDVCNWCLDYPWPCDAFLIACAMEEQSKAFSLLVADLIAQRDALSQNPPV